MKKNIIAIGLAVSLMGCTMSGSIEEGKKNNHIKCKHTINGEEFSYYPKNVKNIKVGFGCPTTFEIETDDGRNILFSSEQEKFYVCERIK